VDIISGGRLEIGLGAGWNQMECDAYGIPLPPIRERFDRFDEGVQVMVELLSAQVSDFNGDYYTLTGARCEPKPVQRPHPPITIGGRGPKRTLLAAARWAQQWNALTQTVDEWTSLKGVLAEHCAAVGRDPGEIECSVNVRVPPGADLSPVVEQVAAYADAGADIAVIGLPDGAEASLLVDLANALSRV